MVGDNPIADVKSAKTAGLKTMMVHNKSEEVRTDYYTDELPDIKKILWNKKVNLLFDIS